MGGSRDWNSGHHFFVAVFIDFHAAKRCSAACELVSAVQSHGKVIGMLLCVFAHQN